MPKLLLICCIAFSGLLSPAFAGPYIKQSQRYIDCTVQSRTAPDKALSDSITWLRDRPNDAAALHCKALAEYAIKEFAQAATTLTLLNEQLTDGQPSLKANILLQAAHAHRMDKTPQKAIDSLTEAIGIATQHSMDPVSIALLHERAGLYQFTQAPHKAVQDLDHILSLTPADTKALLTRAKLFAIMGKGDLSQEDYAEILKIEPAHDEAIAAIKRSN